MRPDQPGFTGEHRRMLDDLAQRLARLPASHPSAPGHDRARESGRAREGEGGRDGEGAHGNGGTGDGAAQAAQERPELDSAGGGDGDGGRHRRNRPGHYGAAAEPHVPGVMRAREPYRPWFSGAAEPWFGEPPPGERGTDWLSSGSGGRSG